MSAEDLIAAIVANPEDESSWLVYADWLLERGDPRGELIRFVDVKDDVDLFWRLRQIVDDEERLISPRLAAASKQWRLDWHRGFIRHATLTREAVDLYSSDTLPALCRDPHVGLLEALGMDFVEPSVEYDHEGQRLPGWDREARDIGDVGTELARLPRLADVTIHGVDVAELYLGRLKGLAADPGCSALITGRFELPNLEGLTWELAASARAEFTTHSSFIRRPPPRLRSLHILRSTPEIIPMLSASAVLRQLQYVALDAPFEGLLALRDHAAAFAHVHDIAFGWFAPALDAAGVAVLREELEHALPNTKLHISWDVLVPEPD